MNTGANISISDNRITATSAKGVSRPSIVGIHRVLTSKDFQLHTHTLQISSNGSKAVQARAELPEVVFSGGIDHRGNITAYSGLVCATVSGWDNPVDASAYRIRWSQDSTIFKPILGYRSPNGLVITLIAESPSVHGKTPKSHFRAYKRFLELKGANVTTTSISTPTTIYYDPTAFIHPKYHSEILNKY